MDTILKTSRLGLTPDAYILNLGEVAIEAGGRSSYHRTGMRELDDFRERIREYLTLSGGIHTRVGVLPRFEIDVGMIRVISSPAPFDKNREIFWVNLWDGSATGRLNVSQGKRGAPVVTLYFTYGGSSFVDSEGISTYTQYGATISKIILKHHLLSVDFLWTGNYHFKHKYGYRTVGGSTYYLETLATARNRGSQFENDFSFGGGA